MRNDEVPYMPKEVADIVGISPTAVRDWGKELESVLDEPANPGFGRPRRYSEDDIIKLHTAKVLRADGDSWDDVIATIEAGERILPPPRPEKEDSGDDAGEEQTALVSAEVWERMTKPFNDHIATLEARLERTEGQLDTERESRLDAEKRAAAAEALAYRIHGWQFWKPKKPEG